MFRCICQCFGTHKVNITRFDMVAFSFSAVQSSRHPLTLTSPDHWATLENLHSGLRGSPFCVESTYGGQEYQACTDTKKQRISNRTIVVKKKLHETTYR